MIDTTATAGASASASTMTTCWTGCDDSISVRITPEGLRHEATVSVTVDEEHRLRRMIRRFNRSNP